MKAPLAKLVILAASALLAGLVVNPTCFAQQSRVKAVNRVAITDSKGKLIGASQGGAGINEFSLFTGPHNEVRPMVLLQVDEWLVAVNVTRNRFYAGRVLYFDSEECTGKAWYPPDDSAELAPLLPRTVIVPPGQTLYVETLGAGSENITVKSHSIDGNCTNRVFTTQAVRMQPLIDLLTVFTPPFSLKAAP